MINLNSPNRNVLAITLGCCLSIFLLLSFQSNAQISGTVFRDFNANGIKDNSSTFNEPFAQGVNVKYILASGVTDSTITDVNGAYSFNASQIPAGTAARIEFYPSRNGDYSSAAGLGSSTSVQFVNAPFSTANFGINYPIDYSQTNPFLIVSHYVGGTLTGGGANFNALIKFTNTGYTGEIVSSGYIPPTQVATHQQLGAVYGNAYSRVSKKVYSGAVLRRHVVFGPLGIGGLYETDPTTNVVTNWLDIETLSGIDAGTDTRNSVDPNNSIPSNPSTKSYDVLAFPLIGKQSLGDVEISEDGSKLYVVNLYQQSLVAIDVNTKALIGSYAINAATLGLTCPQSEFRPWGLKYYRGKLYVGVVCSAETSQLASDLKAYVLEFDPSNTGAGFSIYYSCNLNYTREQAEWNPWNVNSVAPGKAGEDSRNPQPILSNIEFDIDGSLILGLLDRHAMMFSSSNFPSNPSSSQTSVTPFSEGDILRVCNLSSGLSLEGTAGCAYNSTYSGGGEFYDDRRQGGSGNGNIKEDAGGALAIMPGLNEIISTSIDEFDVNENGICWWNNSTGVRNRAYMVFDNSLTGTQGKASGLGDIELLSDAAPTEIGNRVWFDSNSNGIQDADESGIAGVTVQLLDASNTIIATATTDANGNYYFSNNANGVTTTYAIYNISALLPSTNYTVRIPNAAGGSKQSALGTNALTITDAGTGNNQDLIDNDGAMVGNHADKLFTTDLAGHNNHNLDFGFGAPAACTTPDAGVDVTTASGTTVILTGINPATGTWTSDVSNPIGSTLGATIGGVANVVFSSTAIGIYSFIYTNGTCTDTMNVVVTPLSCCLGNYVFSDLNQNGLQDNNEVGVAGVTITLYNASNVVVASMATDAYGKYQFCGLTPGDYKVGFSLPANYIFTGNNIGSIDSIDSDPSNITGITSAVTLVGGDSNMTVDAGIYQPQPTTARVGDRVWFDTNGDGIQDPTEHGVSGVLVMLYNCANPNNPIATTMTDALGNYHFETLNAGSYVIEFSLPVGMVFTPQSGSITDNDNSDANSLSGKTSCFNVAAGDDLNYIDAGIKTKPSTTISLGDRVWNDVNQNGLQDANETGVSNVTVTLYDASGVTVIATTTTNSLGMYGFNGFPAGCYVVGFSNLPGGYVFTTQSSGTDSMIKSDANIATGKTSSICVSAGSNNPGIDAGIYNSSNTNSVGDKVWYDVNKNGLQDVTEYGYPGVVVSLYDAATNNVIATTTTNANGNYLFDGLANGNYYVGFGFVSGYQFTGENSDAVGILGASNSDANPSNGLTSTVSLTGNTHITSVDAGVYTGSNRTATSSLGDIVWYDINSNGIQEQGETGVAGITVKLFAQDATTLIAQAITDGLGNYIFTNLSGGNYIVEFSNLPSGYVFTTSTGAIENPSNSDANVTTGMTSIIPLGLGEDKMTVDAGIIPPSNTAGLGNYVWFDLNANGLQDINEPPVAGITVKLYDGANNVVAVTNTNKEGNYLFVGLTPGTYSVGFDNLPSGYFYTSSTGSINAVDNSDANITDGKTSQVTLAAGDLNLNLDAGIVTSITAVVGNYVWYDENSNGIQDVNEAPIPGVLVTLYDNANLPLTSAVTDANGKYLFINVLPGTYTIGFEGYPSTLIATTKGSISSADDDSNIDPATNKTNPFTIAGGESNLTLDAGFKSIPIAGLGNYVWYDVNQNGLQDAVEPAISGVIVHLYTAGMSELATAITDGNGAYSFPNLEANDYIVGFSNIPPAYAATNIVGVLNDPNNSDIQADNKTAVITLLSGTYNPTIDAGFINNLVLPIDLNYFMTTSQNCDVKISWNVSNEINVDHYAVMRKSDSESSFSEKAIINVNRNCSMNCDYIYIDENIENGNYAYQLKVIDIDGAYSLSKISTSTVNCNSSESVKVYPNPINQVMYMELHAQTIGDAFKIEILDMLGNSILKTETVMDSKLKYIILNTTGFAKGIYQVNISNSTTTKTFKILKAE